MIRGEKVPLNRPSFAVKVANLSDAPVHVQYTTPGKDECQYSCKCHLASELVKQTKTPEGIKRKRQPLRNMPQGGFEPPLP